jgi:Polyketide cyclase / dehydrase and lipid transport
MRPVTVTVDVEGAADEVFRFVSDVENNPRWQRGMRSCRWTSPPPHGSGATYDQVAHFLGRDVVSSFVVTEHAVAADGGRVRFATTVSPFPIIETRTVAATGAGSCRVTAVVEGDAAGFYRVASTLLRPLVARSVTADYARLAGLLGAGPQAPGVTRPLR